MLRRKLHDTWSMIIHEGQNELVCSQYSDSLQAVAQLAGYVPNGSTWRFIASELRLLDEIEFVFRQADEQIDCRLAFAHQIVKNAKANKQLALSGWHSLEDVHTCS